VARPSREKPSRLLPFASLRRTAFNRGVLGRQPLWALLSVVLWIFRRVRVDKQPKVVAIEKLLPGQSMTLTTVTPLTRRQRRATSS
jgi:hypothetical protein